MYTQLYIFLEYYFLFVLCDKCERKNFARLCLKTKKKNQNSSSSLHLILQQAYKLCARVKKKIIYKSKKILKPSWFVYYRSCPFHNLFYIGITILLVYYIHVYNNSRVCHHR